MGVLFQGIFYDFIFGLVTSFSVLYLYTRWAHTYWRRKGIPYLEPKLPFGHYNATFFGKEPFALPTQTAYKQMKAKGFKYGGLFIIAKPIFMPIDPETIKQILIKDFNVFQDRGLYTNDKDDPLSVTLFRLRQPKWRKLRNKLSPTFTSGKIKSMFQTLVKCGEILEETLEALSATDEPIDIKDVAARFTTDIISFCAFGLDCSSLKDPDNEFRKYGKKVFENSFIDAAKGLLGIIFKDIFNRFGIKLTNPEVESFFMNIIHQTVDYREKNNIERKDMLDLLIKLKNNQSIDDENNAEEKGESLTFNELAAQCFVFFLAGFETSSTTMTFALLELSQNPDIQAKVREEIRNVLRKHNGQLTYESVMEMTYMDKVIHETLRKFPALAFINRENNEDWVIPRTDKIIPKGTAVFISSLGLHMDPEYYPDPEKFDPERFTEEEKNKRPTGVYLPFGDGPRNCIGARFGLLQTKVGLASFLKNYKYSVHPKTILPIIYDSNATMLTHKHGIFFNLEKV